MAAKAAWAGAQGDMEAALRAADAARASEKQALEQAKGAGNKVDMQRRSSRAVAYLARMDDGACAEIVREGLVPLIARVKAAKELEQNPALTAGGFDVQKQEKAVREIASTMGFSWDCGRMDVSLHPFCGGSHPSDVRITTRYKELSLIHI